MSLYKSIFNYYLLVLDLDKDIRMCLELYLLEIFLVFLLFLLFLLDVLFEDFLLLFEVKEKSS